jgi:hypothetical protein
VGSLPQRVHMSRHKKYFGCTDEQWVEVRGSLDVPYERSPVRKWTAQREHAKRRGIAWDLTLWQWWSIWSESGHWNDRGPLEHQYCMARHGDAGAYAVGNVYIATNSKNHSDAWTSGKDRKPNIQRAGRGVYFVPHMKRRPYEARWRSKRIGFFASFEEARNAYLTARSLALSMVAGSRPVDDSPMAKMAV